jgi:hypothetical protein
MAGSAVMDIAAGKEVILTAGAINSPKPLMLSSVTLLSAVALHLITRRRCGPSGTVTRHSPAAKGK